MIVTVLLTGAATVASVEVAPKLWRWLTTHKPRLLTQAKELFGEAEAELQPIVSTVEKEAKTVNDALQQKFAALGAALHNLKVGKDAADQRAATSDQHAADLQAQLDAANAHIAELTAAEAEVEGAVTDLANQAAG